MRLLVVEDDPAIASFLVKGLREAGFAVDQAGNGGAALEMASRERYDVAIVDLMLPGLDGLALIEELRRRRLTVPVIILSARRSVDDRVRGLQAGGDDYLTKPFAFEELLARVQALIRRATGAVEPTRLVVGDLALIATTYALLSFSLQQRDREVVRATLTRYASAYERGGLGLLERVIDAERAGGRYEPLFVRVLGGGAQAVYFSMPDGWTDFDVARLRPSADGWSELSSGTGGAVLEVLSARLSDGVLFQVGKSTEPRAELPARVRRALPGLLVLT